MILGEMLVLKTKQTIFSCDLLPEIPKIYTQVGLCFSLIHVLRLLQ